MSRLCRLCKPFGSSAARPAARTARLGVQALGDRLVPSATFTENLTAHTVTVTAAPGQHNDTVAVTNDGDGNLTVTADGVTRTFAHVSRLEVFTDNGADTVTYTQGSAGHEADTHRSFTLWVELTGTGGDEANDRFTADVFGDVGKYRNGVWEPKVLSLNVEGGWGDDRIDFHFHDTDVHAGSTLKVYAYGDDGFDAITLDMDGEVDGKVALNIRGGVSDDSIAVNLLLDAGSTGSVGDANTPARVRGDEYSDHLLFAVRQAAGSHARVFALVDGGLGFLGWPDDNYGQHTANVRTAWLQHDTVIT
jgi:hypothetical protein